MAVPRFDDVTLPAAFATAAHEHAYRVAVVEGDREVCYSELAERAGGIAAAIHAYSRTATTDQPVGLLLDHGVDMVAAILGGMAAGRCYFPLDPAYPEERLRAMFRRAGATTLFTTRQHRTLADGIVRAPLAAACTIHEIDELGSAPYRCSPVDTTDPAYILFTSGSTGEPKGVVHSHRSVLHGIGNHVRNLKLCPQDRLSLVTSFSYDMAVSDLYGALLSGAAVVLCDLRTQGIARLASVLDECEVTVYHSTPTVFRTLINYLAETRGPSARLGSVRLVLLGGELTNRTDLLLARKHFGPECVFVNGYGATEVSFTLQNHIPVGINLTRGEMIAPAEQEVLPIGRPLDGYEPVLLDLTDGTPLNDRQFTGPAELAIRSDYLALGYWRDPISTAERFGRDGKLYRTGDVVRRLADGTFLHLGRKDRQVKIRGQRVELGEIEAALESIAGVVRAVAAPQQDGSGGIELHAFVLPSRGSTLVAHDLRKRLARWLPTYMLPQRLSIVATFPLTASGKVDVLTLLAMEVPASVRHEPRVTPIGEREQLIARIWSEVLDVEWADREMSFFDAGGTSLTLMRLQYRLSEAVGVEIPLVQLTEQPTVAGMARMLDGAHRALDQEVIIQRIAARRIAQQRRRAEARPK